MTDDRYANKEAFQVQRQFLGILEAQCSQLNPDDFYLWPRSPIHKMQIKIAERVGVSDYEIEDRRSRPAVIIEHLRRLRDELSLPPQFSVLDIACGDGLVLWQIKKRFPDAGCFGVDINKGRLDTHAMVQRDGVELYRALIQGLFSKNLPSPFDVLLMLNTYRGWESADLRDTELELPKMADRWFESNGRFTILTAVERQIVALRKKGFFIEKLGKGEDDSVMICLSKKGSASAPFWRRNIRSI